MAKRIKVLQNGIVNFQGEFEDDAEAKEWLARKVAGNNFGKPERWVRVNDEDVSGALETRTIEVLGESVVEYKMSAQYSIVEESTDAEIAEKEAEKLAKDSAKAAIKAIKENDFKSLTDLERAFINLVKALGL